MGLLDNVGQGLQNDVSYITNDVLGIKSGSKGNNQANTLQYPWITPQLGPVKPGSVVGGPSASKFYPPINIDPTRWNQLYPYRLLVVDVTKSPAQIVGGKPVSVTSAAAVNGDSYLISFAPVNNSWAFTLPITPQQLNITDQYAINTTATLRGVIEEHNGVKFKTISASGSLGVWPYRESVTHSPTSPGLIRSLLGNTLNALGNVVTSINNTINAFTGGIAASKPVTVNPPESTAGKYSTGYAFAMALSQFLEQYAECKKNPANAGWRLVFDIPKQNQSFVVSPIQFNWSQNANKPVEINYAMQFKAWRRISLNQTVGPAKLAINTVSPGILQQILNTLTAARSVMASAVNLISAVQSDITAPLAILSAFTLLLKSGAGVGAAASELGPNITAAYSGSINTYVVNNSSAILTASPTAQVKTDVTNIVTATTTAEGLSTTAVANGQVGISAANYLAASPSNQIYTNPAEHYDLLSNVPLSGLSLTTAQQNEIGQLLAQIQQITVSDLKQWRATIGNLAYNISNYYGTSTSFYNKVFGKGTPTTQTAPLTIDQFQILNSLYGVMSGLDTLTATTYYNDIQFQTNMEYVAGLAASSDITFDNPNSQIIVPVPYGLTIEAIALKYLADPQRWLEIVTLNNLREPYIDETGFQYPLLSNGYNRQITVSSDTNLYVGQVIQIISSTMLPTARTILDINVLSSSSVLLTVDGDANMNLYTTVDMAYLQAYLPGTTNSQHTIYIPSDQIAPTSDNIQIPAVAESIPLVQLSNVDFLMTTDGDLATNNYGDFRLSAGMQNLIQALYIKMATVQGTVITHPELGLGIRVGMSVADLNAQTLYDSINKQISDDPRFAGIASLNILVNPASLQINLDVYLAGNSGILPLTYDLAV